MPVVARLDGQFDIRSNAHCHKEARQTLLINHTQCSIFCAENVIPLHNTIPVVCRSSWSAQKASWIRRRHEPIEPWVLFSCQTRALTGWWKWDRTLIGIRVRVEMEGIGIQKKKRKRKEQKQDARKEIRTPDLRISYSKGWLRVRHHNH